MDVKVHRLAKLACISEEQVSSSVFPRATPENLARRILRLKLNPNR